jgi:hypothetical protein
VSEEDPFEFDDAAYVLGVLPPAETVAFEQHLRTCADCAARVREIQGVPDLLADISPEEVAGPGEPVPDTLLPGLLRRAARRRRRQRWLVGGLAAAAVACLIALVVAVWPSSSTPARNTQSRPFASVIASPVRATATLTGTPWGTAIDLHCHYVTTSVDRTWRYDLVVYGADGRRENLGSWALPPDKDIDFTSGTWLPSNQISRLDITLPDGTAVLRLQM